MASAEESIAAARAAALASLSKMRQDSPDASKGLSNVGSLLMSSGNPCSLFRFIFVHFRFATFLRFLFEFLVEKTSKKSIADT